MLTTHSYVQKYGLWTAFNLCQAALLSPLFFMHPAILARAGLYTAGMMGSIAFVGATAKQVRYSSSTVFLMKLIFPRINIFTWALLSSPASPSLPSPVSPR